MRVSQPAKNSVPFLDPGWLFLLAGLGIIAATVLVPAADDLARARWMRDRALAYEEERLDRLARHEEYLEALERAEPSLVKSLVASQFNQVPADRSPIPGLTDVSLADASVFPSLEPTPVQEPEFRKVGSVLERWTTNDRSRVWMLGAGCFLALIGMLPSRPSRSLA